jgi:septal ring factor EnvC (AmiA/AmiB activator)
MKSIYSSIILFLPILLMATPALAADDFADDASSTVEFKSSEASFDEQSPVLRQIYGDASTPNTENKSVDKQVRNLDSRVKKTDHEIRNQVRKLAQLQRQLKTRQAKLKSLKHAVVAARKTNHQLDLKIAKYKNPHRQIASRN